MLILAISLFLKGLLASMNEYGVPQEILNSPHYIDAITWVYIHMSVIGIFIVTFGFTVTELSKQKWVSLIIMLVLSRYTYLDFIHSDSVVGNALYKGSQSVFPGVISLLLTLSYLRLTIQLFRS